MKIPLAIVPTSGSRQDNQERTTASRVMASMVSMDITYHSSKRLPCDSGGTLRYLVAPWISSSTARVGERPSLRLDLEPQHLGHSLPVSLPISQYAASTSRVGAPSRRRAIAFESAHSSQQKAAHHALLDARRLAREVLPFNVLVPHARNDVVNGLVDTFARQSSSPRSEQPRFTNFVPRQCHAKSTRAIVSLYAASNTVVF